MKTGTVKWFNARKGYGFIKPVDGGFDVYVHISAVKRAGLVELKQGEKINFDTVVDERTGEVFSGESERSTQRAHHSVIARAIGWPKGIVVRRSIASAITTRLNGSLGPPSSADPDTDSARFNFLGLAKLSPSQRRGVNGASNGQKPVRSALAAVSD